MLAQRVSVLVRKSEQIEPWEWAMKRLATLLLAIVLLAAGLALAPAVRGVGACIGPITKSAVYTYADRYAAYVFGDPVKYYKFKMTGTFCYDSLGNAWGAGTIKWANIQGPFIGLLSTPVYVRSDGFAYAKLTGGYQLPQHLVLRIGPRLKISGVNGRFTAFDTTAAVVTESGQIAHEFDPVFVSAVLQ
jgi:hypothetical protein